jgi:hypothetical protein
MEPNHTTARKLGPVPVQIIKYSLGEAFILVNILFKLNGNSVLASKNKDQIHNLR